MSLVRQNKKPVKIFLIAILIGISLLYLLCDYYLKSVGRELMVNWVRAEAASIQEGNLLTSSTKNQRVILSSDYIKSVKLIRTDQNQVRERLQFGEPFDITINEIPQMTDEVVIQTKGFLHKQAFYKIAGREEMYMIFDVQSNVLDTLFLAVSAILLLMVISLVAMIRSVEEKEFAKREEIFKQAINDFVSKDKPSDVIANDFPSLMIWWKDKKEQVATAQSIAIKNQTKIMLGEMASRVGHDIMGSIRNIETLFKRTHGLDANQTHVFIESVNKIKSLAADISKRTKQSMVEQGNDVDSENAINLNFVLSNIIKQKNVQYGNDIHFKLSSHAQDLILQNIDLIEFERSVANLINNAAEASSPGSEVLVDLSSQDAYIKIQIKDYGHGISPENLKKIGMKGFTANKNGTGIGIFYAKQFVESLGGRLIVESVIGQGTVVNLVIPIR